LRTIRTNRQNPHVQLADCCTNGSCNVPICIPLETNQVRTRPVSSVSLRSDGSDSEVLNRLEHLKQQLKDKEARLQQHVNQHQTEITRTTYVNEPTRYAYQPPSQPVQTRKQSPGFLLNAARMHHRDSPTGIDRARRILETDDDLEFKPSYFRDDTILLSGVDGHEPTKQDYHLTSKRPDSTNKLFETHIEKEASRRRYGFESTNYFDDDDPSRMANVEYHVCSTRETFLTLFNLCRLYFVCF
jgi:hypothetical protein